MLQAFVVTLREGLEAFLIVAISLAYLRKTGRVRLLSAIYWGILVAILTSIVAGYLLSLASNQALWEGILALTAAILVSSLVIHMLKIANRIKRQIEEQLEQVAEADTSVSAWWGTLLFVILMITREGMETALLLGTLIFQMDAPQVLVGAILGLLAAAAVALLWSLYGHRVNLGRFLQITAVFLLVFSVQLFIYGIHELSEANVLPWSAAIHEATEPYGPDGFYGRWLTYGLVVIPLSWLLIVGLLHYFQSRKAGSDTSGATSSA